MPFSIVRQDITKMEVDAIVNAANTQLQMGGGVCGAIFQAAGAAQMQSACEELASVRTGEAVITSGFSLPAKYVIHTPGPVYSRWKKAQCRRLLRSSYTKSLEVAREAVMQFLDSHDHDMTVYLAVFDKSAFRISQSLLGKVESYIDERYIDDGYPEEQTRSRQTLKAEAPSFSKGKAPSPQKPPAAGFRAAAATAPAPMSAPAPTSSPVPAAKASMADPFHPGQKRLHGRAGEGHHWRLQRHAAEAAGSGGGVQDYHSPL